MPQLESGEEDLEDEASIPEWYGDSGSSWRIPRLQPKIGELVSEVLGYSGRYDITSQCFYCMIQTPMGCTYRDHATMP